MANETLNSKGSYATFQASQASVATGAISTGAVTAPAAAISGEDLYTLLDFKIIITSGTPIAGNTIDIYRRPSDGTNNSPIPVVADYLANFVGSVKLDNTAPASYYYMYGVANPDDNDTYYMVNNSGVTLTFELQGRGRTYGSA